MLPAPSFSLLIPPHFLIFTHFGEDVPSIREGISLIASGAPSEKLSMDTTVCGIVKEERSFACGQCGRAFSRKDNLRRHEAAHEGALHAEVGSLEERLVALEGRILMVGESIARLRLQADVAS